MPEVIGFADSPERIVQRANQEDPWVMYLVLPHPDWVHMSKGKVGAQIGHGVGMVMMDYFNLHLSNQEFISTENIDRLEAMTAWLTKSYTKVILSARQTQWERIKEELPVYVVRDHGKTEVTPGTETVLACWPMLKSTAPKLIRRLQVFKE